MHAHSEILKSFRLQLSWLVGQMEGRDVAELPLQRLAQVVDGLYRAMGESREVFKQVAGFGGDGDFYSLAAAIHRGEPMDQRCAICLAQVAATWTSCKFCQTGLSDAVRLGPYVEEVVEQEGDDATRIYPPVEDFDAPKVAVGSALVPPAKPMVRLRDVERNTKLIVAHARKERFSRYFPYPLRVLNKLSHQDLRSIAALCVGAVGSNTWWSFTAADLCNWILNNQPQEPVVPGPLPIGSVPDLAALFAEEEF